MQTLNYPYANFPDDQLDRLQVDVGKEDYRLIRSLSVRRGTLQGVGGILLKKLCDRLREAGINDFTQEERFINYVNNLEFPRVDDGTRPTAAELEHKIANDIERARKTTRNRRPTPKPATVS